MTKEQFRKTEDYAHIYAKAIEYLSWQGFSERKLLKKITDLKRRYPRTERYRLYTEKNVQWVLDDVQEKGYLNEEEYARSVVRSLSQRRDGMLRIKQKLYVRLVKPSIIQKVLSTYEDDMESRDYSKILEAVLKKREYLRRKYRHDSKKLHTITSRLYGFLAQKGFIQKERDTIMKKLEAEEG